MHFHSLDYLVFLVIAVGVYWLLWRAGLLRLLFVWLASCAFYMAWRPYYILLILGSTLLDYTAGRAIAGATSPVRRKAWLCASLLGNLGLLGTFKYFNFFASATSDALGLVGVAIEPAFLDVALPVGISFYTFQTLSYTIDVYRGRMPAETSFLRFAVFVTFFPQLVAGPIVRAADLLPQLARKPAVDSRMVGQGLLWIATGMVKKVAVADYVAVNLVDRVFDTPTAYSSLEVLLGLYGYTLQIYCDFSGYTDVARGSALLFGLRLPENFDRPYQAVSPADFWRRWHMTLSSWLRDYLYFPLGGSRGSELAAYRNLFITLFLIGLWHGAAWTFVIYGTVHALAMLLHRFATKRFPARHSIDPGWLRAVKIFGTLQFVVVSRVFFRGTDVGNALDVTARLGDGSLSLMHMTSGIWLVLALGYLAHYTPKSWYTRLERAFVGWPAPAQGLALAAVGAILMLVATQDVVPYIYFQF
jgi:alginate O-acetyltransferase complex protein AlgI